MIRSSDQFEAFSMSIGAYAGNSTQYENIYYKKYFRITSCCSFMLRCTCTQKNKIKKRKESKKDDLDGKMKGSENQNHDHLGIDLDDVLIYQPNLV